MYKIIKDFTREQLEREFLRIYEENKNHLQTIKDVVEQRNLLNTKVTSCFKIPKEQLWGNPLTASDLRNLSDEEKTKLTMKINEEMRYVQEQRSLREKE